MLWARGRRAGGQGVRERARALLGASLCTHWCKKQRKAPVAKKASPLHTHPQARKPSTGHRGCVSGGATPAGRLRGREKPPTGLPNQVLEGESQDGQSVSRGLRDRGPGSMASTRCAHGRLGRRLVRPRGTRRGAPQACASQLCPGCVGAGRQLLCGMLHPAHHESMSRPGRQPRCPHSPYSGPKSSSEPYGGSGQRMPGGRTAGLLVGRGPVGRPQTSGPTDTWCSRASALRAHPAALGAWLLEGATPSAITGPIRAHGGPVSPGTPGGGVGAPVLPPLGWPWEDDRLRDGKGRPSRPPWG